MAFYNSNLSLENSNSKLRPGYNEFGYNSRGIASETSDPFKIFGARCLFPNSNHYQYSDSNQFQGRDNSLFFHINQKKEYSSFNLNSNLRIQGEFSLPNFKIEQK